MKEIFNMSIKKGVKKVSKISVGNLAHGAEVSIPVLILRGKESGPTLWINSAVHGDELNGSVASWELFHELSTDEIAGDIIITPIANPLAFVDRSKISDIDYLDMDTIFPGDPQGLFAQRVAYKIFSEIKEHANYVLNFHTLNTYYQAVPYTVSKNVPNANPDIIKKSKEMALSFGTQTNCFVDLSSASGELPGVTNGALDITCIQNNIPAFMAEVGSGGKIESSFVSLAKEGINNLLIDLGLKNGEVQNPGKQYLITKRKFLRADHAGLVKVNIEPGDIVSDSKVVAETHYFGNNVEQTKNDDNIYVIATRVNPVVNTGDRLAFVGTEWEEVNN